MAILAHFKKFHFSWLLAGLIFTIGYCFGCKSRLGVDSGTALADTTQGSQPYACFVNAQKTPYKLTQEGAIALCGGTDNASLTLSCYNTAINTLNLSNNGAFSLCSRNYNMFNNSPFRD